MSDKDLCADIQKYLDGMFDLVQQLKVPGRKAKCKFEHLSKGVTF